MNNIFNPVYRQEYLFGYARGFNPYVDFDPNQKVYIHDKSTDIYYDIKDGVFYKKLDGYTIKIGRKENDSIIHNVVIYEHNYTLQDNIILAERGTMTISPDQRFLAFNLKNVWRYQ